MTNLSINQIVANLGPWVLGNDRSNRLGVWTQGCSLGRNGACYGCMSKGTHSIGSLNYDPRKIVDIAIQHNQEGALVISGGEPTDQPEGLVELLNLYRDSFTNSIIQLYTGRTIKWISKHYPSVLDNIDVLIANPFKLNRAPLAIAGSNNQVVHLLSELGREQFSDWESWPRKLQLLPEPGDDNQAVLIGIPDRHVVNDIQFISL